MIKTNTKTSPDRWHLAARLAGLIVGLVAVSGCSVIPEPTADPTRYYLLSGKSDVTASTAAPHGTVHLGIRAIEVPTFLRNTRSMVVRQGPNEIRYEDFARWAEPLEAGVQRIVRERLLSSDNIATAEIPPFVGGPKRDFDVVIRVVQCEGEMDANKSGVTRFVASYEIFDLNKGGELAVRRTFVAPPAAWSATDFSQLAARLGDAVGALGADIAQNLPH